MSRGPRQACIAEVLRATATNEALAVLEQRAPTVIVADLAMPDRDGIDLIRSVRKLASPSSTLPAAMFSAHAASELEPSANEACFQMYIEKPVRPEVFVGRIAALAGLH